MPNWLLIIIQLLEAILPILAKKQQDGALSVEENADLEKLEAMLKIAQG